MARELGPGDDLRRQFAELAIAQGEEGREALSRVAEDAETAIHDARKSLKKLRSTLRLARTSLGDAYDKENAYWRDVGRRMSESRDAAAMVEAFDDVVTTSVDEEERADFVPMREALEERRDAVVAHDDTQAIVERADKSFRQARRRLGRLSWPADGGDLKKSVRVNYARLRKAFEQAAERGDDDDLHTFRKRAKDHTVHIGLLRAASPQALKRRRNRCRDLADLLGKDHDLAVMTDLLEGDEGFDIGDAGLRGRFTAALHMRRRALRKQALSLGRQLCKDKPKAFARDLVGDWSDAAPLDEAAE